MYYKFDSNDLIEKYSNMIYGISLRYLENEDDAQDIVQEVFIKYINYMREKNQFNDESHEKS